MAAITGSVVAESAAGRSRRPAGLKLPQLGALLVPLVTFVLLVVLAEIVLRMIDVKPFIVPLPSAVLESMWVDRDLLTHEAGYTLVAMVVGFLAAVVAGIALAMLIVSSSLMNRAVYPILVVSQVVPSIALAPIFLIWFGNGLNPKIILVAVISFFPIVVNTVIGFRSIEQDKMFLARTMRAGPWTTYVRFQVPNALPYIFAGLRLAATSTVIGAVVGEFMGGQHGLGFIMLVANGALNTKLMFAAIGYTAILGLGFFVIVAGLERLAIPWHVASRGTDGS